MLQRLFNFGVIPVSVKELISVNRANISIADQNVILPIYMLNPPILGPKQLNLLFALSKVV